MNHNKIKVILTACFVTAFLISVAAQDGQKKGTSYAPVDIKESFATIMSRMKSAKPGVMKRQMDLLNERYDLSKKVTTEVKMSRGKPVPVGPAARLASGQTWEKLAEMSPEEIKDKGLISKGISAASTSESSRRRNDLSEVHDRRDSQTGAGQSVGTIRPGF